MFVNGILLFYHHPLSDNAPTILDHVKSFQRYSEYPVWEVNTCYGFPAGIQDIQFSLVVLHYSLFGSYPFELSRKYISYIAQCSRSAKVAFFQDEYRYCDKRCSLINRLNIDIIYSLLNEGYFDLVYRSRTNVKHVLHTLAGYVPEGLTTRLPQFAKPFCKREIDVGYRARQLPYFMGRGGQEKTDISTGFIKHLSGQELRIDISNDECKRIYGDDWFRFIGSCKFMLGVEAGVSIFDFDGTLEERCNVFLEENPNASFEEVSNSILKDVEGNVNYRMISPRIFESAALQTVPLLFNGFYNGIIKPGINYIAIEKDFSNINLVLIQMADDALIQGIIKNNLALISRFELSYPGFISSFDEDVKNILGIFPRDVSIAEKANVDKLIKRGFTFRRLLALARYRNFPGRNIVKFFYQRAKSTLGILR
jgi:hypothetical protein